MTADEFLAIPATDQTRWIELIDDELVVFEPNMLHNVVATNLLFALTSWVREAEGRGRVCVPLDVAVEIRSPSTWRYDIGAKKSTYERYGLPELWLVDTAAAELLVFRRSRASATSFDVALELAHGETLESPLLPGFALALDELFETG